MKTFLTFIFLATFSAPAFAQQMGYRDSLRLFQKQYVDSHEVVKGKDKEHFKFYKVKSKYRVAASLERVTDSSGFIMKTTGKKNKRFYRFGILHFMMDNKPYHLSIYQGEELMKDPQYKDYLFVPFTDKTSGKKSYAGGRYLDFTLDDIRDGILLLDFNKAYNPYCAYASGYNCPIPPAENDLDIKIKAGEKEFGKKH